MKIAVIVAVIASAIAFVLSLCKAAAKGNIYCPDCGSEEQKVKIKGEKIVCTCNKCRHG